MLVIAGTAAAKPVGIGRASDVASRYFPMCDLRVAEVGDIYVFSPVGRPGFVLVAASDCVRPVLGYSYSGSFDVNGMPPHVAAWIEGYNREISAFADAEPSAAVQALWEREGMSPKDGNDSIGPLLTTTWNQAPYYNLLCPYDTDDSAYVVAGCTATATAQILKYWNHPEVGFGSHAYYHPYYGVLSARFDTTHYRWSMMPDKLNYLTPTDSVMAVAELIYHVGVSVNMNYSTHGSGAAVNSYGSATRASAENALKQYFKYNPLLYSVFKSEYADREWDSMLCAQIVAGRPVLYAGYDSTAGHAFVLDGYDTDYDTVHNQIFFHVNWGWGGAFDGFYTTDSLSPGAGGIGGNATYTFNYNNSAVMDIMPFTSADTGGVATISMEADNVSHGTVTGSGSYTIGVDTAVVWAHAAEGYRFVRWKSGSMQNPITFIVFGDLTDTAVFEPLGGDTLGYCFDGLVTSWLDDYGSTTEWGIRLPAPMRGVGRGMRAVQLFPYTVGDHTLKVYFGDSIPTATLAYTKVIQVTEDEMGCWNEYALDSLIPIPEGVVVWVTMSFQGTNVYPAAMSRYSGNSDGSWYHLPAGWVKFDEEGIFYGTWMLRAVTEPRQFTVLTAAFDPNACSTYGDGIFLGGQEATVGVVILDQRCQFLHWSDGSPYNPYSFVVSGDTLMTAFCQCPGVGIDEVEAATVRYAVDGRTVTVSAEAAFYDVQGRQVGQGREAVMPTAGVYIMKVGNEARKIVVK